MDGSHTEPIYKRIAMPYTRPVYMVYGAYIPNYPLPNTDVPRKRVLFTVPVAVSFLSAPLLPSGLYVLSARHSRTEQIAAAWYEWVGILGVKVNLELIERLT